MAQLFQSWYTLVVFGVIIAVIIWAFSPKNKAKFDDIAKSVIEDENSDSAAKRTTESKTGV